MIANVDGVVVVAGKIGPFLVDFRQRDAASEDGLAGPGGVDVLERVRDGVGVRVLLLFVHRIGLQIKLGTIEKRGYCETTHVCTIFI
jgi:hypothetical protein